MTNTPVNAANFVEKSGKSLEVLQDYLFWLNNEAQKSEEEGNFSRLNIIDDCFAELQERCVEANLSIEPN